ncbi:U6 snRNA-associated Sm-like protein LSm8 [Sporobolomyces koalae]|uniref:U6 snRNA-associated Sm-like protein LSm8 n=1 Tax=Sporobolomyces koalae TaxID=500713 RepID=UPI0031816F63
MTSSEQVLIVTQDGRTIVGELKGFDQTTNVILSGSTERVFSTDEEGTEEVPLGVYIIRGDNIALIGEVDTEVDGQIDWSTVKAEPIAEVIH